MTYFNYTILDFLTHICRMFWHELTARSAISLSGIVYLNTDINTCLRRVKERNRQSESGIDLSYLSNIQLHQDRSGGATSAIISQFNICIYNNDNNNDDNNNDNNNVLILSPPLLLLLALLLFFIYNIFLFP